MSAVSCCPPNSHVYLASSYVPVGSTGSFENGTEYYKVGNPNKNAILIIPDVFGWNGCRIRNIADQLAEAGYYVVIPKLLIPNFEGGTDGDGLPADFFTTNGDKFMGYIATITWEGVIKPKVMECLQHFKSVGVSKIGVLGFCWGGVMVAKCLTEFADDGLVCGVVPHPSFQLEDFAYGGSSVKMMESVKKPMLLMPAGNDADNLRAGGELFEALKKNNSESQTLSTEFAAMQHGWSLRGDVEDAQIKAAVQLFLDSTFNFLAKFF